MEFGAPRGFALNCETEAGSHNADDGPQYAELTTIREAGTRPVSVLAVHSQ